MAILSQDHLSVKNGITFLEKIAILALVWALGYACAQAFFWWVRPAEQLPAGAQSTHTTAKPGFFAHQGLNFIRTANIFDTTVAPDSVLEPFPAGEGQLLAEKSAFEAELAKLSLKGVITGFVGNNFALIAHSSSPEAKAFSQGDALFETNLTLAAIRTREVDIQQGDLKETLRLSSPKTTDTDTAPAALAASTKPTPAPATATVTSNNGNSALVSQSGNTQDYVFQSADIETELKDFNALLLKARVEPHKRGDEFVGYQIKRIEKNSIFERMGLVDEDIIKSVNGEFIDSPEKALSIFRILRNETEFNLQLERKGTPLFLNYSIQ